MNREIVLDTDLEDVVPHGAERFGDVELHLPRRFRDVDRCHVHWRDEVLVHQRENAEPLHSATRCLPLWR